MLLSRSSSIAFAHFPKTAGTSLQRWFIDRFPDAELMVAGNPHLPVRLAAGMLLRASGRRRFGPLAGPASRALPRRWFAALAGPTDRTRVLGVIRDPFEMLVSLYEFWRRALGAEQRWTPLMDCAARGSFRDFVHLAVVERQLATYEHFFDLGGPLWRDTTLLDFTDLEPALAQFCRREGIPCTETLPALNRSAAGHDLRGRADEIGDLMAEIRRRYRWYYEEGLGIALRGDRPR